MVHIIVNNSECQVKNIDSKLDAKLKKELRYKDQNVEFSLASNEREIERVNSYLDSSKFSNSNEMEKRLSRLLHINRGLRKKLFVSLYVDGKFPTGLLPRVLKLLDYSKLEYEIIDKREKPKLKKYKFVLKKPFPQFRYYQKRAVKEFLKKDRGIIVHPTGTGKSLTVAKLVWELGVDTLIITPNKSITDNMIDTLKEYFGKGKVDRLTSKTVKIKKPINVVNIQALIKIKPSILHGIDAMLIDEFHRSAADTYRQVSKGHLKDCYFRLGLSVSGKSTVQYKDSNSIIHNTTFENLSNMLNIQENEIRDVSNKNIQVLSWDYESNVLSWKDLKAIHKYKNTKKLFKIKTDFNKEIILTEDHSLMKIVKKDHYWVHGRKKYNFDITESSPKNLKKGDLLLCSSSIKVEKELNPVFNLEELVGYSQAYLDVPKNVIDSLELSYDAKYRYKNVGKFGSYCPEHLLPNYTCTNDYKLVLTKGSGTCRFKKRIQITESLAYLYGFYLGDGYFGNEKVVLCAAPKFDIERIKNAVNNIKDLFPDVKLNIQSTKSKSYEVHISCLPLFYLFKSWVGNSKAKTKQFKGFEFNLPANLRKAFLSGLEHSDGHENVKGSFVYTTCSKKLAKDIDILVRTLGYRSSIRVTYSKSPNSDYISTVYRVHYGKLINKNKSYHKVKRVDSSYIPIKIKSIEIVDYEPYVYDFTVPDSETFVANDILVHNTATNFRNGGDGLALESVLSEVIDTYSIEQAIIDKYLVPPEFEFIDTKVWDEKNYQETYKKAIVENEDRNFKIEKACREEFENGKHIIILVQQIEHGEILKKALKDLNAEFIHGGLKNGDRQKMLEDFNKGKLRVLIGSSVIGEGVNLPIADTLICGGAGKAKSQVMQNVGRVLRPFEGKDKALIIDFTDEGSKWLTEHSIQREEIYYEEY